MVIHNCNLKSPITSLNPLEDITERNESLANQTLGPNDTDSFPLLDDDALMSTIDAIPYSQDDTDRHYSPVHKHHLNFYLDEQLVLQTGGAWNHQTFQLLSSVFSFGSRSKFGNKLRKFYPGHPCHPDQSTNTHLFMGVLKVIHDPSWMWKSQAGWIDDGMELTRSRLRDLRALQNEDSHWSNLQSHYNTSDTDALDLLVNCNMVKFMRGRSLLEMALFNALARAARTLEVDIERTAMSTSIVANNDEGLSASADDVVQCLSGALVSIDTGRLAHLLPSYSSADPNDVLGFVSTYKERFPEIATLNNTKNLPGEMELKRLSIYAGVNQIMWLWILCTKKELFVTHLKLLLVIVQQVYSATDEDDLRLILSRIRKFE